MLIDYNNMSGFLLHGLPEHFLRKTYYFNVSANLQTTRKAYFLTSQWPSEKDHCISFFVFDIHINWAKGTTPAAHAKLRIFVHCVNDLVFFIQYLILILSLTSKYHCEVQHFGVEK